VIPKKSLQILKNDGNQGLEISVLR